MICELDQVLFQGFFKSAHEAKTNWKLHYDADLYDWHSVVGFLAQTERINVCVCVFEVTSLCFGLDIFRVKNVCADEVNQTFLVSALELCSKQEFGS